MTQTIPQGFDLRTKVSELSDSILHKHPRMPTLLKEIWTALKSQPENVTLMSDEEIAVIVRGLENQTNTYLADSVVSSKGKTSKSIASKLAGLGDDAL